MHAYLHIINHLKSVLLPFIYVLLLFSESALAQSQELEKLSLPYTIQDASRVHNLDLYLSIFEDKTRKISSNQITALDYNPVFKLNTKPSPNYGYSRSNYWLRFYLSDQSGSDKRWLLEIDNSTMTHIVLCIPLATGEYAFKRAGTAKPFYERELPVQDFTFSLPKVYDDARPFYIGLYSDEPVRFSVNLWPEDLFFAHELSTLYLHGVYFGIILIMALYHLFIYISIADRSYLYFVLFVFGMGLGQFINEGLAYKFLWPEAHIWNQVSRGLLNGFTVFWAVFFTRSFLQTRVNSPRFDQVLVFLAFPSALLVLLHFSYWANEYESLKGYAGYSTFAISLVLVSFLYFPLKRITAIKRFLQKAGKNIFVVPVFGCILFVLSLTPDPGRYVGDFDRMLNTFLSIGGISAIAGASLLLLKDGYRPARFFLIGMSTILLGGLIEIIVHIGIFPHNLVTSLSSNVGVVIGLILLSLALGDRINTLRRQMEMARAEADQNRQMALEHLRKAAESKFEALQAKINPHFLFNTLNSIASLISDEPQKAERAIEKLSRLFRYTLNRTGRNEVSLADELEIVRYYLEIEQMRLEERLRFRISIEGDIKKVRIPPFILQPLVENSVKHGIAPQKRGGRIDIFASAQNGRCSITVKDTGKSQNGIREMSGHGLQNVRERLSIKFEKNFEMQIQHDGGVEIKIAFPINDKRGNA